MVIFLLIYLIGFLGAIFLIFYKFSLVQIPLIFGILTLFISFLIHLDIFTWHFADNVIDTDKFVFQKTEKRFKINFFCKDARFYAFILFFLFFIGLFLLYNARTGNYIQSPWDVIPKIYLYVYLIATLIVAFLIFSKQKIGFILFIIILHSFLLHAYLPIIYQTGFGENKWKHLGIEKQILNIEENFAPSIENKNENANQWALTIFLSKILNVDIFWIDLLLLYLMWSIFIPLIFFELAKFLFQSFKGPPKNQDDNYQKRFLLLTAFLPSLFFHFQVYGSTTTPIALGYLFFFFVLLFWLDYLITQQKISLITAIILSMLMFFGNQINFILILIIGIGILISVWQKKIRKIINQQKNLILFLIIYLLFFYIFFSFLCFIKNLILSNLNNSFGLIAQNNFSLIKENVQNFALFFSGYLPIIINFCIFSLIILGIFKIKKMSHLKIGKFLISGFLILGILNFFSFYFVNLKILSANIKLAFIFFVIFLLSWGIYCFLNLELEWLIKKQKIIII